MKLLKLLVLVLPLFWLAGCGSSAENEGGVAVDDLTSQTEGSGYGADEYGTETQVVVGGDEFADSELDDPSSPLSNRVVYFEYDSSSVRPEDQATLQAHAAYLADHPNVKVRLEGHTDERGSREYNLALGERRALSIRQILTLQGASVDQFQVTSFGEERPAVDGSGESAWSQNRRVEIVYIGR